MRKRADQVEQTRRRIIDAAVHLHGTVGPAASTIAGIAEQAGVTRLTVYRHFADEQALFEACSAHWLSQQVPPDPAVWQRHADPEQRLRAGLADLYRFYRAGEPMLARIDRDHEHLPAQFQQQLAAGNAAMREVLVAPLAGAWDERRLRALIGHAMAFSTWRSLCLDQQLPDSEAVEAMVALVLSSERR
jgi:AcrR family transcriptional regulator